MIPIYLDNHTTTRTSAAAIAAMQPYLREKWGVPAAPHAMGHELLRPMEEAYDAIYKLLGARESDNFILTSSGTEAVNHAVMAAYLDLSRDTGRNHFITTAVDEAPVIMAYERLELLGCEVTHLPVGPDGTVSPEAFADAITPRTAMLSLSWANGLTGAIQPVQQLADLCRERGIWCHLDATHVLGKLDFDLDAIAPDLLSFNGDHLHAPKGTGGLWIRSGLRLSPLILGATDQGGLRAGSFSVANLVALGTAATELLDQRDQVSLETARLRDRLEAGLLARVSGGQTFFQDTERLPTTAVVAFPGAASDALLYLLHRNHLYASFGGGAYQQLGLQLETAGIPQPLADCAISLSLSRETTEAEIDRAIDTIADAAIQLQSLSETLV